MSFTLLLLGALASMLAGALSVTMVAVIGTEIDKRSGSPIGLLAREEQGDLQFAGGAFFALTTARPCVTVFNDSV
jgi:hypothetical protein